MSPLLLSLLLALCAGAQAAAILEPAAALPALPPIAIPGAQNHAGAALAPPALRPEISYLNALGSVRVYFAEAPGFGHQAATLSIVRRLRDLDYNGKIEAVFDDSAWQKLAELLPEFDPAKSDGHYVPSLGMSMRPLSSFKKGSDEMPLGLTGGADVSVDFPAVFNTRTFIRMGPMDWGRYDDEVRHQGHREYDGSPKATRVARNNRRRLIYRPAGSEDVNDEYFNRLKGGKYDAARLRGFAALARKARQSDVLPVYGLAFMQGEMLHQLALGASRAYDERPELFKGRGIVMPLLLDAPGVSARFEALLASGDERLRRRVKVASIADPDIDDTLRALGQGDILVLKVGSVPPAFFEWLFRRGTLPPSVEGKNALNLARLLGIPYIAVPSRGRGHTLDDPDAEMPAAAPEEVPALRLGTGAGLNAVTRYLIDALTPGSPLRAAFEKAQLRQDDYEQDKVLAAVRQIMAEPVPSRPSGP